MNISRWKLIPFAANAISFESIEGGGGSGAAEADRRTAVLPVERTASHGNLSFPEPLAFPRAGQTRRAAGLTYRSLLQTARTAEVPALSSTLLQLELLLEPAAMRTSAVDLGAVSTVILNDLGATLQILRLAGGEYDVAKERPRSIEQCIANFSTEIWVDAISAPPFTHENYTRSASLWEHSRSVAKCAQRIALDIPGVNPAEAYLAGLLHDIGMLPAVLGWKTDLSGEPAAIGSMLATEWSLPQFVMDALDSRSGPASYVDAQGWTQPAPRLQQSKWAGILSAAHELDLREGGRKDAALFAGRSPAGPSGQRLHLARRVQKTLDRMNAGAPVSLEASRLFEALWTEATPVDRLAAGAEKLSGSGRTAPSPLSPANPVTIH